MRRREESDYEENGERIPTQSIKRLIRQDPETIVHKTVDAPSRLVFVNLEAALKMESLGSRVAIGHIYFKVVLFVSIDVIPHCL